MNETIPTIRDNSSESNRGGTESRATSYLVTCGVIALAMAGQVFMNLYPAFIGALGDAGRATPAQLGRMVTVEYFSMALTALFAGKVLSMSRLRAVALVASVVQLVAVIATTYVAGNQLLPVRAVFAAACGIQTCIQYEFVAQSSKPGQLVGVCTTVVVLAALVMSWVGSTYVTHAYGINALILFFGFPSLLAIGGTLLLPRIAAFSSPSPPSRAPSGPALSAGSFWLLASGFTWSAWISILWVYAEPLSKTIGISDVASQTSISAALIGSLAGAGAGATLAERLPTGRILIAGLFICLAQVISLLLGVGSIGYVVGFSAFGFFGYFLVPMFVKALAEGARGRQSIVFFPAAQYAGGSLGPLIASFVVAPGQYRGGLMIDMGCISAAIACLWIGLFFQQRVSGIAR